MIDLKILFTILITHWVADFVLQSDWMAKWKSKDWAALIAHTATYTAYWIAPSWLMLGTGKWLCFILITFVCHTATDYYTSRVNAKLYEEGKIHQFFVSVGFDQLLHYTQLIITYWILK